MSLIQMATPKLLPQQPLKDKFVIGTGGLPTEYGGQLFRASYSYPVPFTALLGCEKRSHSKYFLWTWIYGHPSPSCILRIRTHLGLRSKTRPNTPNVR
ncbi:MAG: hypothetical protein RBG13Loki_4053 [Promethearchaeota archaeon CR_4]|nr:MAG: hypothetical protein RBG13Loki_4053 [Candidatus Lokiarchaeota archaeon CR_4]